MTKLRTFRCHYLISKSLQQLDQLTNVDLILNIQAKDPSDILKKAIKIAKEKDYILQSIEEI